MVRSLGGFRWLPVVPLVAAALATVLFALQHGFGGGHGAFDQTIGLLALPGILLIDQLPLPNTTPDFLLVVLLPAVLNALLWLGLALTLRRLLPGTPTI